MLSRNQYQAQLSRIGQPITDATDARQTVRDLFGQGLIVDPLNPEHGEWWVQLPEQAAEVLNSQRFLEVVQGNVTLLIDEDHIEFWPERDERVGSDPTGMGY